MRNANWKVVEDMPERFVIQDVGPWENHPTITNDAEEVVKQVAPVLRGRRLLYYDSDGQMYELLVDKESGNFIGFSPGNRQ